MTPTDYAAQVLLALPKMLPAASPALVLVNEANRALGEMRQFDRDPTPEEVDALASGPGAPQGQAAP